MSDQSGTRTFFRRTDRVIRTLAWLFLLFTLGIVAFLAAGHVNNSDSLSQALLGGTGNAEPINAFGLDYASRSDLLLHLFWSFVITAAAIMTLLPAVRARRIGHLVLIAWCGLWLANILRRLRVAEDSVLLLKASAVLLGIFFFCTVYRAVAGWPSRAARLDDADEADEAETEEAEADQEPQTDEALPEPREAIEVGVAAGEDDREPVQALR